MLNQVMEMRFKSKVSLALFMSLLICC